MAGTTKVWVTRCRSTKVNHWPASNLGRSTICLPECRAMSRPERPPDVEDGRRHHVHRLGRLRLDRLGVEGQPVGDHLVTDEDRLGQTGGATGEQHQGGVGAVAGGGRRLPGIGPPEHRPHRAQARRRQDAERRRSASRPHPPAPRLSRPVGRARRRSGRRSSGPWPPPAERPRRWWPPIGRSPGRPGPPGRRDPRRRRPGPRSPGRWPSRAPGRWSSVPSTTNATRSGTASREASVP